MLNFSRLPPAVERILEAAHWAPSGDNAQPWTFEVQAWSDPLATWQHDDGLKPLIGQIAAAIWQIASVGTPEQQARGREALIELRRKLHSILAEPDQSTDESTDEAR